MTPVQEGTVRGILVLGAFVAVLNLAVGRASGADPVAEPAPGTAFRDCTDGCPEMVAIGPGRFLMGTGKDEDEREETQDFERNSTGPRHFVEIAYAFAIGKYPVTRSEFAMFARDRAYEPSARCYGHTAAVGLPVTWRNPGYPQSDRDPVVCMSWDDAQAYLAWLSDKTRQPYRLPSEAEWEYVARAGTSSPRPWGAVDDLAIACRYANVADHAYWAQWKYRDKPVRVFDCTDGYVHTSPVGSFLPNAYGVHDMLGNAGQLVADCWHESYAGAPSDGSAWLADPVRPLDCMGMRVVRGGSFADPPIGVRSA